MSSLRIFLVGGVTSYRALFHWLTPWILIPSFVIAPLFQILLFAYIGRAADLESDRFYVIGNALQYAAIPCLFAMTQTIGGERFERTLGPILASPAGRVPLFLGRALPVLVNGWAVSAFALAAGAVILGVHVDARAVAPLLLVTAVSAFACTGLGLVGAGLAMRVRETAVLANVVFGFLLVFCGVNVPLDDLPAWMSTTAQGLPLTHGIEAARRVGDGQSLADVGTLVAAELGIGIAYAVAGYGLLRFFEVQSRRRATLELA